MDNAHFQDNHVNKTFEQKSLQELFIHGSVWIVLGQGSGQVLRLLSNLILTRLLVPEVFGLMALVNVFIQGLQMFSDVGLNLGVIQSKRGDEQTFLDTVWTIQVARGIVLWMGACILAAPLALFYEQPLLQLLFPVAGVTALIEGFASTKIFSYRRHLKVARLVVFQLLSNLLNVGVILAFTLMVPSIWSLVYGGLVGALCKVILSHYFLPGIRNCFHFESRFWKELFRFGKWVFMSTALSFLVSQGDRMFLGKVLTIHELGIYSIAFLLSQTIIVFFQDISYKLLLPIYSYLIRNNSKEMIDRIVRIRRTLLTFTLPIICLLIVFGRNIVSLFYDSRYHEAGWMLEILSAGSLVAVINSSMSPILLASGNSFRFFLISLAKTIAFFVGIYVGWKSGGVMGLITGITVANFLFYPILVSRIYSYGIWSPRLDLIGLVGSAIFVLLGKWMLHY